MSRRLPATPRSAATVPPPGLPGLDPRFSRLVDDGEATWHVLDTGAVLAEHGVEPVGTVLCVHGNPTWSYLWRRFAEQATDAALRGGPAWRVVAVDQLEMGFSERTGERRPLARRVADLGRLTDALGLAGPVVTFGHDWGGVVSLGWAVDHPELLAGVMLLNTAIHQPEGVPIPAPLRLALAPGVLPRGTVATPAFLETTLALASPPLPTDVRNAYRAPYRGSDRRGGIGAFVADIPVGPEHESFAELERIAAGVRALDVPALFVWGPRDPIFSDRYLDDLIDRMPHADVHRFEGAGHLVAEDADYAGVALAWLDERLPDGALSEAASGASHRGAPGIDRAEDPSHVRRPLWHHLDERADSDELALAELAPPTGPAPRRISWRLLSRRVHELAAGLVAAGVRPGDRVSLLVPPGADLTAALYACLRIGAVVVVADAGLGVQGLTRAVRGAYPHHVLGAVPGLTAARALGWPGRRISTATLPAASRRLLGVDHSFGELVALGRGRELPPEPAAGALAAVLFTSGSTGPAKGVRYTHAQLEGVRDVLAAQYGIGPGTGLVAGFAPFALLGPALGARSAAPDMDVTAPATLTARAVAAAAREVDATALFLSPAAVANVLATEQALGADERAALGGIRLMLSAGAPLSPTLLEGAAGLLPNASVHTPYGMTEGLLMTDVSLETIRDAATSGEEGVCVGTPAANVQVRISALDDDGRAVGELSDRPHVTGEIVVSAPHVKSGYDRLWFTDRAAVAGTPDDERWHRTSDVGHFDAEGRLWVEGRLPHVVVTAHGVVTPVGVEQRVETVPDVRRAALAAVGPRGTQHCVVVLETVAGVSQPRLAPADLASAVRTAAGLPVAAVLVVPALPTDIRHNSKIDRTRLSRWAEDVLAGGRMTAP
ncbi:alpha/beta fold hydrolase [Herbiconiux sp. SYSU D00978]|uniref:alpha/beta fold hydrolase n=1 Tax=Herbiconiux sp. SYSU D00978 TaxID=2812562 RepID=UPI001A95F3F2|nr:alpha/beta fold hydrolase [Herbiconiux sp. SYSU D00978]